MQTTMTKFVSGLLFVVLCGSILGGELDSDAEVVDIETLQGHSSSKKFHIGSSKKVSWEKAIEECLKQHMKLATIESQQQQDQLESLIRRSGLGKSSAAFWISGSAEGTSNDIYWNTTGTKLTYTNWGQNEPRVFGDYRCLLVNSGKYQWMMFKCSDSENFVCED